MFHDYSKCLVRMKAKKNPIHYFTLPFPFATVLSFWRKENGCKRFGKTYFLLTEAKLFLSPSLSQSHTISSLRSFLI